VTSSTNNASINQRITSILTFGRNWTDLLTQYSLTGHAPKNGHYHVENGVHYVRHYENGENDHY